MFNLRKTLIAITLATLGFSLLPVASNAKQESPFIKDGYYRCGVLIHSKTKAGETVFALEDFDEAAFDEEQSYRRTFNYPVKGPDGREFTVQFEVEATKKGTLNEFTHHAQYDYVARYTIDGNTKDSVERRFDNLSFYVDDTIYLTPELEVIKVFNASKFEPQPMNVDFVSVRTFCIMTSQLTD